ncbi:carboxypeptidase regulatory-like domain-containing protein [Luteimonas dalianensis]|uniref:carboxypeptidase regulatory-like domain-containing protein n=1 Tax=Luteimonas dalianensis TaxID=1148196 RepID=UPI003BF40E65
MNPDIALALVLALAVLVAWVRLLFWQRRVPGPRWKLPVLLLLQPLCAGLLYLTFMPPRLAVEAGTMTVLTAGADAPAVQAAGGIVVALPEAPRTLDAEPVPDLATALRRHPDTARLQVLGQGLDPRDREAVRGRALGFEPPPLPPGLVELHAPARAAPGTAFDVHGRINAMEGGQVRLLDPAGQVVDAAELDAAGAFHLRGYARAPGLAIFPLQVLDADGREADPVPVPLEVVAGPTPRVLLLAGAPGPEFRHLRRWAEDAGLELHVEVAVGRGVGLGDGPAPSTAEGFAEYDLVILDERALGTLGAARRSALAQALDAGTGVLVRLGGAVPAAVRAQLADLGMALGDDGGTAPVDLAVIADAGVLRARMGPGSADAPFDPALADQAAPELLRRAVQPGAVDAVPMSVPGTDAVFAWWRARGRGRIGLWTLLDSHRLALAGRGDLHGGLWSAAVASLARPALEDAPGFESMPRAGRRTPVCGLPEEEATISAPDGTRTVLQLDPAAGPGRCAAFWPQADGWHRLHAGDRSWPFHILAADAAPGLAAAELREGTVRLAGEGGTAAAAAGSTPTRRGPSWPWFLAWLAASGLLWWLERRRPAR